MYLDSVKRFYNKTAQYFSHTRNWLWRDMQSYLNIVKDGDKVLDLGCGNGRMLKGISSNKIEYTGVDFSKELISIAKEVNPKSKFLVGDITRVGLWKRLGKFDVIFCIAVLHHIGDRKRQLFILKQAKKHLSPGGVVVFSVWNLWHKQYLKHHLSKRSLKLKLENWRFLWFPFQNKYQRFCVGLGKTYLSKLFKEAGFEDFEIRKSGKNIWIKTE